MAAKRVYLVERREGGKPRLVYAAHPSQAQSHVAESLLITRIPTNMEVAILVGGGTQVEQVGGEQQVDLVLGEPAGEPA